MPVTRKPVKICVYGSSSKRTPKRYLDVSYELGTLIASQGHICINGAGANGAMGALNRGLLASDGQVIGVCHEAFVDGDIAQFGDYEKFELVIAKGDTLAERKRLLAEPADAFIALPGGVGTWEELWEVACLNALGLLPINRPVAVVNTDGFYSSFYAQLQRAHEDKMLHKSPEDIIHFAKDPSSALAYVLDGLGKPCHKASVVVGKLTRDATGAASSSKL